MPVKVQPRLAVEADSTLWLVSALTPYEIDERFSQVGLVIVAFTWIHLAPVDLK